MIHRQGIQRETTKNEASAAGDGSIYQKDQHLFHPCNSTPNANCDPPLLPPGPTECGREGCHCGQQNQQSSEHNQIPPTGDQQHPLIFTLQMPLSSPRRQSATAIAVHNPEESNISHCGQYE
uniref:Uncharacterized protein n=1 Tax=Craspedostauros australis TaxID=1486917 RepID=A0A7R9ZPP0_9STRA